MRRIVSLISSATEIVDALGEIENLVGRSHECDYPERVKALPVCTRPRIDITASSLEIDRQVKATAGASISIYEVFEDVIDRLEPTHIITQIQCDVCAVSLRDVEAAISRGMKSRPAVISLNPDSLAGIWADIRRVAQALDIVSRGEELVAALEARMNAISSRLASVPHPRVACLEWIEPLMAAGNWGPELIALAGGQNLFGEAGRHSPWMTWEQLSAADPDVIVAAPCGFDLERTASEMYWLSGRPAWREIKAVKAGRVYIADGNQYFNRPGPRVVDTLEILSEMLHPEHTAPRHCGSAWRVMM